MDGEDPPQLSATALAALQDFYVEQALKSQQLENNLKNLQNAQDNVFEADWQLSQFWYSSHTAETLAKEAIRIAGEEGQIALLSCPTILGKLISLSPNSKVKLLEYDRRFSAYTSFIFYDYKEPLNIPEEFEKSFDVVIADPPFLSEECLTRVSQTIKFLAKDKIMLCTGAVMESKAKELLNVMPSHFKPQHNCNLANEFVLYSNYDVDSYI